MFQSLEPPNPIKNPWEKFSFAVKVEKNKPVNLGKYDYWIKIIYQVVISVCISDYTPNKPLEPICLNFLLWNSGILLFLAWFWDASWMGPIL